MLQFTPREAAVLSKRAGTQPAALEKIKAQCGFLFTQGIKIPVGTKSTWVMFFQCPKDSVRLCYDYAREKTYVCPACGGVYSGEPYEGAWWRITIEKVMDGAWLCAVVWMLTGEKKYFQAAREVLVQFADKYAGYRLHGGIPYNNPGRISSQTLCEAMALRSLCMTYDIIGDVLSQQERRHIEDDLLAQSAQVLVQQRMNQLHNHEVVIDAALGMAGLVLSRGDFLDFAIESKYGLKYQLTHGVLPDGLWFEGTLHYHFFTLEACMLFEKFACRTPYSLMGFGIYEKMYAMPLQILEPDYRAPFLGDGSESMFLELAGHYEYPYRLFQKPEMAQVLRKIYSVSPRDGIQAFLYGVDSIPPGPLLPLGNYHDDGGSGLTVLRGPEGSYLLFKHGHYGGEHDHYDKLGIHFLAGGCRVADDLGTVGYGAPHHYAYFKNTAAHNTVCINGLNQPPADGRVVQYACREDGVLVEAHADWCGSMPELDSLTISQWDEPSYAGVTMRRALLFGEDYFVEAFLVRGAEGRTVDWVLHPRGEIIPPPEACRLIEAALPGSAPQSFLRDAVSFSPRGLVETRWRQPAGDLRLFSACSRHSEMIYAKGPANPPTETLFYVIHRTRPGREDVLYINLFAFGRAGALITGVSLLETSPGHIRSVVHMGKKKRIHHFTIGL